MYDKIHYNLKKKKSVLVSSILVALTIALTSILESSLHLGGVFEKLVDTSSPKITNDSFK